MKKTISLVSLLLVVLISCKKDAVCYVCKDAAGNYLQESCGKDEQDAFDNSGLIEGVHDINKFRQRCSKK